MPDLIGYTNETMSSGIQRQKMEQYAAFSSQENLHYETCETVGVK